MNIAATIPTAQTIKRAAPDLPVFAVTGAAAISIRAGTEFSFANGTVGFEKDFPVATPELIAGQDYYVSINAMNDAVAVAADGLPAAGVIGGFHFAPGGNAEACSGGDETPAINPASCWDLGHRPACPDPRGMALVEQGGLRFWCDIYLLGKSQATEGTSRFGAEIADGRSLTKLDYATAKALIETHGKQLLGAEEFFAAAYGVTERSAAGKDPETAGLDAARTSRFGVMQATGNMWVWGTDGHPDDPRPSFFGGSWLGGSGAGSRYADLDSWPGNSYDDISARGRSDHLAA